MRRIAYDQIVMHPQAEIRQQKILDEIEACGDGVLLTDALSNKSRGGLTVLQILSREHSDRRYKIRPLKDMWGQPVKPGDVIEWHVATKTRNAFGKKLTNAYKKELQRRGRLREIETWHDAKVDFQGYIDVDLHDALILLDTRGVHFESKEPLTGYKEVAREPKKGPDGKMRLQHFWLYEEVPPWDVKKPRKPRSDRGKARATTAEQETTEESTTDKPYVE